MSDAESRILVCCVVNGYHMFFSLLASISKNTFLLHFCNYAGFKTEFAFLFYFNKSQILYSTLVLPKGRNNLKEKGCKRLKGKDLGLGLQQRLTSDNLNCTFLYVAVGPPCQSRVLCMEMWNLTFNNYIFAQRLLHFKTDYLVSIHLNVCHYQT